ncbi:MAG: permease [Candidatus Riflebacteria bacterium]|nr:permease [Candidatus Riflebacteria bacterium]
MSSEQGKPSETSNPETPCGEPIITPPTPKEKKKREERAPKSPLEKVALTLAWIGLAASLVYKLFVTPGEHPSFLSSAALSGIKDLGEFLSTHLVSAMIPAFFVAAAISTFLSRETVIKTMGKDAPVFLSYPLAALAGAILTVCSCGILPIFMSMLQSGSGLGPSFTFLFASPAINLISLIYTWKILPTSMMWARVISVFFCSIGIGIIMNLIFRKSVEPEIDLEIKKRSERTPFQEWSFFGLLVIVMMTSTEALSVITNRIIPPFIFTWMAPEAAQQAAKMAGKLALMAVEICLVIWILKSWFTADETRKWLKRTGRQAQELLPMVFLGIFYSGFLGGAPSVIDYLSSMKTNGIGSNLLASFIGAMLYFGSIVGVNVVDLFMRWGMHKGPALALLLSGPAVSLPSILALMPMIGKAKTFTYLVLVVVFSAFCGIIFGGM